jgi:hypothetical protein
MAVMVVAVPSSALAGEYTLHPRGFGEHTKANWMGGVGEADSTGDAFQAMLFEKDTTAPVAAIAVVKGIEGLAVADLTELAWEHPTEQSEACRAGSPRWNINVVGESGQEYTLFLGCAAANHLNPAQEPVAWTRDEYSGDGFIILAAANAGYTTLADQQDIQNGTISSLLIVNDGDGNPSSIYLDNIQVNEKVWTSAADNGNGTEEEDA